jgi:hypothetical protein
MENREILVNEDVLTFKDLIIKAKELIYFFKENVWKISITSLIGGLLGFFYAFFSTPIYPAKIKFLMKESGGSSALMSSLGSLGSLIGGAAGSMSPLDRTLAIMGSEKIVGDALFNKIKVNGKVDLAINHFVEIQKLRKSWQNDTVLNNIQFKGDFLLKDSLKFSERKAYKKIINLLIGEKATIIGRTFDKKSGIFDLTINTKNEEFSIEFNKSLYKELEEFIYNQSKSTSGKNVLILNNKIDSIKSELNNIQNMLARTNDRTLGLLMQEDKVDQKKLMMKEQLLTMMYGEAQKNLETFKFVNESINTGLEVIEYPLYPIEPEVRGKAKFTIIGLMLFGFLGFILFYGKIWLTKEFSR